MDKKISIKKKIKEKINNNKKNWINNAIGQISASSGNLYCSDYWIVSLFSSDTPKSAA